MNRTNLAGVPLAGPSLANMPSSSNTWYVSLAISHHILSYHPHRWTSWLARIKADGTAPNVYTWHLEGSVHIPQFFYSENPPNYLQNDDVNDDLQTTQPAMVNLLNSYGLTIGEFGALVPATGQYMGEVLIWSSHRRVRECW